jgi:hypothetical protein
VLSGCKDPSKQFDLLENHIIRLRSHCLQWQRSRIIVYVERNLGHEAEHHRHALKHLPGVFFREDAKNGRVGVLTTHDVKLGMSTLLNIMLRENRIGCVPETHLICKNPREFIVRLREQLHVYSFQFKDATNPFGKQRVVLTGKVGGMADDLVIAVRTPNPYSLAVSFPLINTLPL